MFYLLPFYIGTLSKHVKFSIWYSAMLTYEYLFSFVKFCASFSKFYYYKSINKFYFFLWYCFKLFDIFIKILNDNYTIFLIILYFYLFVISIHNNIIFYKYINKFVIVLVLIYLLISTFIFLNKGVGFGKYTSQIQRFWKRSYILFWLLEIFLFFLFIFLTVTHFSESVYFLDLKPLLQNNIDISFYFLQNCIIFWFIILTNYLIIYFFKSKNVEMMCVLFFIINILILNVIYYDFLKFFYVINNYSNNCNDLIISNKKYSYLSIDYIENINKSRTIFHYSSLIILIKFWHIVFIYFYYIFVLNKFLNNQITFDLLSSNIQNFLFLFYFNILCFVFYFKFYFLFFFKTTYYWFFVDFSYFNFKILINEIFLIVSILF